MPISVVATMATPAIMLLLVCVLFAILICGSIRGSSVPVFVLFLFSNLGCCLFSFVAF